MALPLLLAPAAAAAALAFGGLLALSVLKKPEGGEKIREISRAIRQGSSAYLKRQFRTIALFGIPLAAVLAVALGPAIAAGFAAGALLSALAGALGMAVSVRANVRVAHAASGGLKPALSLAFRGGAVTGMAVVGLALLGVSLFYMAFLGAGLPDPVTPIVGFAFGASLVSLFARIGGGIYTKSADVGADLVGKIEAGIPEDDPRNPAVIADNVGDNVGDCAGMGADLFETYAVSAVGAMLLGYFTFGKVGDAPTVAYPLLLGAAAIFASIVGVFFVRLGPKGSIMGALYAGLGSTGAVAAVLFYVVTQAVFGGAAGVSPDALYGASLIGLGISIALFVITEYYTSKPHRPVQSIAEGSKSGSAITIIAGLAVGLESAALPAVVVSAGILASFGLAGLYGVAVAVMAMLSLTGIVIALDAYGPVTDNAGGIAEMGGLPPETRKVTDALDAVGNTTKAVTKAFAIGSAALAALTLFGAYILELKHVNPVAYGELEFNLARPTVVAGLLLGGMVPFLFSASCMRAVGRAAFSVVTEVRRQFKEIPGIMEGTAKPDYGRCVDIVTRASLREMAFPGLLAVAAPLAIGFVAGPYALGGALLGSIVTGFFLALLLTTAGGAWDNAKKFIEEGHHGGKGSDAHKAAVVGDTVGDPTKDTAGPAINPLIKVMNTLAILVAAAVAAHALFR
ncbi:MAG: sodium-translocating pyrophosphatase [Halobacteria archaeon]